MTSDSIQYKQAIYQKYNNNHNGQNGEQNYNSQNNNGQGDPLAGSDSSSYTDANGNNYVTNNYYGDYYDYDYAARMRRFQHILWYGIL